MGFIKTEFLTNGQKLSFELPSDGLYQLNCLSHSHIIHTADKILEIFIIKDMIMILTEDRDFRNGASQTPIYKDDRQINNINAYDWNGNHLWNIGNIVGDIKTPFTGAVLSAEESEKGEFLICFAGAYRFVIDPIRKTVISKTSDKW